ncbi:MAG: DNA methylase [Anaerolineales bacterium]|nr:DNA methylase [Anaerolineales bacterium]
MAASRGHVLGELLGNLLEETVEPILASFCKENGLFLEQERKASAARSGKLVTWKDKYGNAHNLDFVIERNGTPDQLGQPVAFIEVAWRSYTKHSRNKAQEIQAALLPIRDTHDSDAPFLGVVVAGVFTEPALTQLRTSKFNVLYFPMNTMTEAFAAVGIDVRFDEKTSDVELEKRVGWVKALMSEQRERVKQNLLRLNEKEIIRFQNELKSYYRRMVQYVRVIPLHGNSQEFRSIREAADFLNSYDESTGATTFREYDLLVVYSNGDRIEGRFQSKESANVLLEYVRAGLS